MSREDAAKLLVADDIDPAGCRAVWNVGDEPVVQRVRNLALPTGWDVRQVRRLGTFKGAKNSIATYPVMRDEYVTKLTLESRLELAWAQQLDFDPRVSALYAQPFALVWTHDEGRVLHIPDLAAVVAGKLAVFEVKPDERMADPRIRRLMELTERSLHLAGVSFRVLGNVSPQRRLNLQLLARYKWPNPFLTEELAAVIDERPSTAGGVVATIEALTNPSLVNCRSAGGVEVTLAAMRIGQEVTKHLLATGMCHTDLDRPLSISTPLEWPSGCNPGGNT